VPVRVLLTSLGCKLNQGESDAIARRLVLDGHQVVHRVADADLHVVNTCTVTHHAARDSRKAARRARRESAGARTVITGCWATGAADQASRIDGVDLVVPNSDKEHIVERIYAAWPELRPGSTMAAPAPLRPEVRTALAIEDGCSMGCSFCVIPRTRGRQRSREPSAIVADALTLHTGGCREVVLTGVQISAYRAGSCGLLELVARLLDETPVGRFRLTSLAPWQVDLRLFEAWSSRLCRHLHLSLQSGCDATLRRMRRPYDTARFARLVALVRQAIPGVAITTDVITGFPGETESDFERSLDFVAAMEFAKVHVFSYSERPETPSASLPDPVPVLEIRTRTARMLEVGAEAERAYRLGQQGREAQVLWEDRRAGCRRGTTDNYVRVRGVADAGLPVGDFEVVRFRATGGAEGDLEAVPA
jgi:threonylcarbamoyladenosine tRNA methylthiotransferase MtaB